MSERYLYLDENEERLEKSEQQVAEIRRTMLGGFASGLSGITLSEITKGFELDDELLGVDDLTKLIEDKLKFYPKQGENK